VGLAIAAAPGWAHTTKGVGDFHAGFLHPLTAPEHIIAFVAFGMLASQQGLWGLRALVLLWIAGAIGATAALWTPAQTLVDLINIASMIALGGMIAANFSYPAIVLYPLAAVVGLSHGLANGAAIEPPLKAYLFIPGYVVSSIATVSIGLVVTDWLLQRKVEWVKIAVRVAGSWIAAIAVLVLAGNWNSLTS
jgi:urease accessory protein